MVASVKVLDSLKAIGLNKYERNLWVALLSRGTSTAGELSEISKVPRSRCYDVLDSLASRGFVVIQPGKPMKYVAIEPRESFDRAKKKILSDAGEMADKMDELKNSSIEKELSKLFKEQVNVTKPEDLTGALKGKYAVLQQAETMMRSAKKNVNIVTTESGAFDIVDHHKNVLRKINNSGVSVRIAVPVTDKNKEAINSLKEFAEVRDITSHKHVKNSMGRFCVVDDEQFVMGLTDDKTHHTQDVAVWTQSSHAASNVFGPIFNMVWENSKPV